MRKLWDRWDRFWFWVADCIVRDTLSARGMKMNLYLISQDENYGYDTYDSAVVAADNEEAARMFHPGFDDDYDWNGVDEGTTWCDAKDVKVEFLGVAKHGTSRGYICVSFNAG